MADIEFPFEALLERAGLTKADLARKLGVSTRAIAYWKESPPEYAKAYLELLIEFNRGRP